MPQTSGTFSAQSNVAGPCNLPGGVGISVVDFSFTGTQSTYDIISPVSQVISVHLEGAPLQITTGTTLDRLTVTNSMNSSGRLTLIAASTNGQDIAVPTVIRASRSGTNGQDVIATIISKGG